MDDLLSQIRKGNPLDKPEQTIEKMTTEVRHLYLKISEQLSSDKHPLTRICTKFHTLFNDDVDAYSEGICDQSPEEIKEFCDDTI